MRHALAKSTLGPALPLACALACGSAPEGTGASSETSTGASASSGDESSSTGAGSSGPGTSAGPQTGGSETAAATGDASSGDASSSGALTSSSGTDGATTGDATTGDATTGDATDTGVDTGGPLDELLTLDHVQVKGTHNSYHLEPLIPFDPSHEYSHAPLDVQLDEQGVRAFELDVHQSLGGDFEVYHIAVIDADTTCASFTDCMQTIKGWSDAHPLHLPIFVWLEIKDETGGQPIDGEDLLLLENEIRATFPEDQLFTPDDLSLGYPNVRAALEAEGWPTLGALRGQVMFILLSLGDHAEDLTSGFTTLAGRAMFARASPDQFDDPWAAVAKLGLSGQDVVDAHDHRMLIATNVCGADEDDSDCAADLETAKASGLHMLKDDFPAPIDGKQYFLDFADGNPARCNPVTAPPECTSEALEDL